MKKGIFFVLFLLLVMPTIYADNSSNATSITPNNFNAGVNDLKTNSNKVLGSEVRLTPQVEKASRTLFGLKSGDKFDMADLVLSLCLCVFLIILIHEIIQLSSALKGEGIVWVISIAFCFIISITGSIRIIEVFFLDLGKRLQFLGGWQIFNLLFILIFITLFFIVFHKLVKKLSDENEIEKEEKEGYNEELRKKESED